MVVTAQLIDTRDGYQLWAERYERGADDMVRAQSKISAGIVAELENVLHGRARNNIEPDEGTVQLYHRALDLLRIPVLKSGTPEKLPATVVESVRLFREVTARSPRFGKGWAGLAEAAEWEYELRGNEPRERLLEAKAAAQRAVQTAPDLIDGWRVLTSILLYREWDFRGAESACRRAIELDPRDVISRQRYIDILRVQGRTGEARSELGQAISLQPAAAQHRVRRALMSYEQSKCEDSLADARAASELTNQIPFYPMSLWVQGLCLEQLGHTGEAERMFRSVLSLQPQDPRGQPSLGHLLGRLGRKSEAEEVLRDLRNQRRLGRVTHVSEALVYAGLGRTDDALSALEQAWQDRDDALPFIALEPRFRTLRSHARFRAILEKLASAPRPTAELKL
jgi:tetratricopeptide (TPR) repeat protein